MPSYVGSGQEWGVQIHPRWFVANQKIVFAGDRSRSIADMEAAYYGIVKWMLQTSPELLPVLSENEANNMVLGSLCDGPFRTVQPVSGGDTNLLYMRAWYRLANAQQLKGAYEKLKANPYRYNMGTIYSYDPFTGNANANSPVQYASLGEVRFTSLLMRQRITQGDAANVKIALAAALPKEGGVYETRLGPDVLKYHLGFYGAVLKSSTGNYTSELMNNPFRAHKEVFTEMYSKYAVCGNFW